MTIARIPCGLLLAVCTVAAAPALGQRIQFSSQLQPSGTAPAPAYGAAGGGATYANPGTAPAYSYPSPAPASPYAYPSPYSYPPSGAAPTYSPATAAPAYPAPTYPAPSYPAPAAAPSYPAPGATYPAAPPMATLEGTIQPPPPQWDPYGTPGAAAPALLPQDPRFQFGPPGGYSPSSTIATMQRFLQQVRLDGLWMPNNGPKPLGISDAGASATFAVPFFYNMQTPLLITPGFAFHFWNGPESIIPGPPPPADLPPRTYDAYLDAAWNPQPTPWLGGELSFRIGVYSDFTKLITRSLRFTGSGLAVLTFSPSFKFKAGVEYLDRNLVKLLPAGGIVWAPNPDIRFDILFPHPKVTKRLTTVGCTEWWIYLSGDYGGGAWTIKRASVADPLVAGTIDFVDYDDLRAALGLEYMRIGGLRGFFEGGVAFERQLRYRSLLPEVYRPTTTAFVHAGVAF